MASTLLKRILAADNVLVNFSGASKTHVLVEKYLSLVKERNVPAEKILLLTNTGKCVARFISLIKEKGGFHTHDEGLNSVKTIFALCGDIVRHHLDCLPATHIRTPSFSVWNEEHIMSTLYHIAQNDPALTPAIPIMDPHIRSQIRYRKLSTRAKSSTSASLASKVSLATGTNGEGIEGADTFIGGSNVAKDQIKKFADLIFPSLNRILMENNALDFDDLLVFARFILKTNKTAFHEVRSNFSHILVDNLQDLSYAQSDVLASLVDKGQENYPMLFALYNPDVTVFQKGNPSFSSEKVIKSASATPPSVSLYKSSTSYSHSPSNNQITFIPSANEADAYLGVMDKIADAFVKGSVDVVRENLGKHCFFSNVNREDNNIFFVQAVKHLQANGIHFRDIAILFRSKSDRDSAGKALMEAGLPVAPLGLTWSEEEQSFISATQFLANPRDIFALGGVLARKIDILSNSTNTSPPPSPAVGHSPFHLNAATLANVCSFSSSCVYDVHVQRASTIIQSIFSSMPPTSSAEELLEVFFTMGETSGLSADLNRLYSAAQKYLRPLADSIGHLTPFAEIIEQHVLRQQATPGARPDQRVGHNLLVQAGRIFDECPSLSKTVGATTAVNNASTSTTIVSSSSSFERGAASGCTDPITTPSKPAVSNYSSVFNGSTSRASTTGSSSKAPSAPSPSVGIWLQRGSGSKSSATLKAPSDGTSPWANFTMTKPLPNSIAFRSGLFMRVLPYLQNIAHINSCSDCVVLSTIFMANGASFPHVLVDVHSRPKCEIGDLRQIALATASASETVHFVVDTSEDNLLHTIRTALL